LNNLMNILFWVACLLAALSPLLFLGAIVRLLKPKVAVVPEESPPHWPLVTIMIAARNEEKNIMACLRSVDQLTYPKDRLEVLVGNDHSEDCTQELIAHFIRDKPWFQLVNIGHNLGNAQGKANVLAQLTRQAKGEYFFFTDADIQLPRHWVESMLEGFDRQTGVVTGFTVIRGSALFGHLQSVDWVYSLGLVSLISDLGIPVSTIGNNMAVTRKAYQATAGYEHLPFSITEDHQLFHEIVQRGYHFKQFMEKEVTALTEPMPNIWHWLHQRKRWMHAAFHSALPLQAFMVLQVLFYPLITFIYYFNPMAALALLISRLVLQAIYIDVMATRVLQRGVGWSVFLYDLYTIVLQTLLLLFYLLPIKINWKNREYPA